MSVDQSWVWPEYKSIGQTGVSRPVFKYIGIAGILDEEYRHMYRYAGLT
jgi:hypothetical protein